MKVSLSYAYCFSQYFVEHVFKRSKLEIRGNLPQGLDSEASTNNYETKEECSNCKSDDAKNERDKCGKHFCSKCEYKVGGEESVMKFFKSRNFR